MIPALCGILSWFMVRLIPVIRDFRVPRFVWDPLARFCSMIRKCFFSSANLPQRGAQNRNQAPQVQPDATLLQQLMAMGVEVNRSFQLMSVLKCQ